MKKVIVIIGVVLCMVSVAYAWNVPDETLQYNIMYKWGLINKKAGEVKIVTSRSDDDKEFKALLTGATAKWADKFYSVRDTLKGSINRTNFYPSYYEKIAREGGDYDRDLLVYTRAGNNVKATADLWRLHKKDKEMRYYNELHEAEGVTLDMLSAFYYMRSLDYQNMKSGESVRMNVFSGSKKEILRIHYRGTETIKIDNRNVNCYHITFTFTTAGGAVSSDKMEAWISRDSNRIPLLMEGKLPVGKVRAVYSAS